ncbi:thymidylate synthase [Halopseudomonas sp.]|uniref:thymidylate synthase n=1 Tax=Halopseudomonas sp. TaxID=2901191 RepID=UPI003002448B|tara:strand:- start:4132 stop:5151 length:1020 start_codon:yes stop_codon:yes gene_type:complete
MHIKEQTLDDLLINIYKRFLKVKEIEAATKGNFKELTGVLIELKNPRSRLSRTEGRGKLFSCLGELAWYLSGSNELAFITHYIKKYVHYSDDEITVYGAYGPRFMGENENRQIFNVIDLLRKKPTSRQAVIQLFDSKDILEKHNDIPCTCTMQFLIRKNKLHMFTSMRSNDVFLGLPHDIFTFTMIQEIIANSLNCKLGSYKHYVCSLHIYEKDLEKADAYINSGYQDKIQMPAMPRGDPWRSVNKVLKAEESIRLGEIVDVESLDLDEYWSDIIRIFQFFKHTSPPEDDRKAIEVLSNIKHSVYSAYLEQRRHVKKKTPNKKQTEIEFEENTTEKCSK